MKDSTFALFVLGAIAAILGLLWSVTGEVAAPVQRDGGGHGTAAIIQKK